MPRNGAPGFTNGARLAGTLSGARGSGMRELAARSGISPSAISLIERDRMSPSVDTLAAVLAALGSTMASLLRPRQRRPVQPILCRRRADRNWPGGRVSRGAAELTVDDQTRVLHKGDAYCFDSLKPHGFRNVADGVSEIISAVTPPTY